MVTNQPDISVLIPCFNVEQYISATLQSVLTQTYQPKEVILVDDGSRDHTLSIIRDFAAQDSRIKVVAQNSNLGVSAARNAGLSLAQGDYIAMLDADDIWTSDALAVRVGLARRFPHVDVIATDFAWFHGELPTEPVGRVGLGPRGGRAFAENFRTNEPALLNTPFDLVATIHFAWTGATLVKRQSMVDIGNFDSVFQGPEDTLLWLRLAHRGAYVFAPQITAFYRQRAGSLVATLEGPKEIHYLKVLRWLDADAGYEIHRATIMKLIAECHHASAMHYRRAGNRKAAWEHAWRALRYQPSNFGYWRNVLPRLP